MSHVGPGPCVVRLHTPSCTLCTCWCVLSRVGLLRGFNASPKPWDFAAFPRRLVLAWCDWTPCQSRSPQSPSLLVKGARRCSLSRRWPVYARCPFIRPCCANKRAARQRNGGASRHPSSQRSDGACREAQASSRCTRRPSSQGSDGSRRVLSPGHLQQLARSRQRAPVPRHHTCGRSL